MGDEDSSTNSFFIRQLQNHYHQEQRSDGINYLDIEEDRIHRWTRRLGTVYVDFSRNYCSSSMLDSLEDYFSWLTGDILESPPINILRHIRSLHLEASDKFFQRIYELAQSICLGQYCGYTGRSITDVIHIGVGGSSLGVESILKMVSGSGAINIHFISSFHDHALEILKRNICLEQALFIVVSKSFQTQEVLHNLSLIQEWYAISTGGSHNYAMHFIAITEEVVLAEQSPFSLGTIVEPPKIEGRFSIWSSACLTILIAIGVEGYHQFLFGARLVDDHCSRATLQDNIPIRMALLSFLYLNIAHYSTQAVLVYRNEMEDFVDYIQQLSMESNGKLSQGGRGGGLLYTPVIWGGNAAKAQHSFFQFLLASTTVVPVDCIHAIEGFEENKREDCFAMSMLLNQAKELAQCKRPVPSTTFLLEDLQPFSLGILYALYEYKVLYLSSMGKINPFGQDKVDYLKKAVSKDYILLRDDRIAEYLQGTDPSAEYLVNLFWGVRSKDSIS